MSENHSNCYHYFIEFKLLNYFLFDFDNNEHITTVKLLRTFLILNPENFYFIISFLLESSSMNQINLINSSMIKLLLL